MELTRFSRIKWEKAIDFRRRGQFREAEDELKEALDEQPESPALRASLAQTGPRRQLRAQGNRALEREDRSRESTIEELKKVVRLPSQFAE